MSKITPRELMRTAWPPWTIPASRVWRIRSRRGTYFIAKVPSSGDYPKGFSVRELRPGGTWIDVGHGFRSLAEAKGAVRADMEGTA